MSSDFKKALERIKKKIKNISQTTEYLVRKEFEKLGFITTPYYYSDLDHEKGISKIRALDFIASHLLLSLLYQSCRRKLL